MKQTVKAYKYNIKRNKYLDNKSRRLKAKKKATIRMCEFLFNGVASLYIEG